MLKGDTRVEVKGLQELSQSLGAGGKLTGNIGKSLRSSCRNTGEPVGDKALLGDWTVLVAGKMYPWLKLLLCVWLFLCNYSSTLCMINALWAVMTGSAAQHLQSDRLTASDLLCSSVKNHSLGTKWWVQTNPTLSPLQHLKTFNYFLKTKSLCKRGRQTTDASCTLNHKWESNL